MKLPWWLPLGGVPEIEAQDLAARLDENAGVQLLDVRSRLEYERGHIPGARSTPIQTFRQALADLELDTECPVVLICRTAHRSIPATRLLRAQGYEALQLAGGMNAWWRHHLPTTRMEPGEA